MNNRESLPPASNGVTATRTVLPGRFPAKQRRRKRQLAWEQKELASNGSYAQNFEAVCADCPQLSIMEARVCAMVRAALPNWKIAEMLGISERTVESHLRSTRKKLGLPPGTRMHRELEHRIPKIAA